MFWLSLGAAAGYYAARKGTEVVEDARERGLVGNVTLAAGTASKAALAAARATVAAGEAVGSRVRSRACGDAPVTTQFAATSSPTTASPPHSREVRP